MECVSDYARVRIAVLRETGHEVRHFAARLHAPDRLIAIDGTAGQASGPPTLEVTILIRYARRVLALSRPVGSVRTIEPHNFGRNHKPAEAVVKERTVCAVHGAVQDRELGTSAVVDSSGGGGSCSCLGVLAAWLSIGSTIGRCWCSL